MTETFNSQDLSVKIQKKFLSKFSNKTVAKNFLDDKHSKILDDCYKLAKNYTSSKKDGEKLVKNIIKILVKISILSRNDQFTKADLLIAEKLQMKFRTVIKTLLSFFDIDFTFDKQFLQAKLSECRNLLKNLLEKHLTEKNLNKVDQIFDFFSNSTFLSAIFKQDSKYKSQVESISNDLRKMIDAGEI